MSKALTLAMKDHRDGGGKTWDAWAALLLMAALLAVTIRLVLTHWTDHLIVAPALALLGAAVGLALGASRFSSWVATLLALAYGLAAVPWRLGLTLEQRMAWKARLGEIGERLMASCALLIGRESVRDPLFFLTFMGVLAWALGVHAGYALARRSAPWRAILPPGVALLLIQVYDPVPSRAGYLGAFLFFSLLLVAHQTYLRRRIYWRQIRALLPPYLGFDLTRVALLVVTALVFVSWVVPALAEALPPAGEVWQTVARTWQPLREHLNRAFAAVRGSVGMVSKSYGPHLPLGRGRTLSDALFLEIQAPDPPNPGVRYYWRARIYDHYAGGVWSSTITTTIPLTPTLLSQTFPELEGRWTATFTFTTAMPILTLYAPAQPLWVSRPAQAVLARNYDDTVDVVTLQSMPYLRLGESYQARASLSAATVAQLRAAGTEYPLWVTERYLQLPPDITPRTRELARQIASGLETPYDVASAITLYLRTYIHYSDTVPSLPPGEEPVDWFLFDLREGFCNYYATAEVVLLRAAGIPARLAVGYATGEQRDRVYQVRQRDRHAWPEVYFPGIGWVEFEPTASLPAIQRPLGIDEVSGERRPPSLEEAERRWRERLDRLLAMMEEENLPEEPASPPPSSPRRGVRYEGVILALVLILFLLARRLLRHRIERWPFPVLLEAGLRRIGLPAPALLRRWARWASLPPLLRAYAELNRALFRLGAPPAPADTPAERAARLARLLPAAAPHLRRLLAEYQVAVYGPRPGDPWVAWQAGRVIRSLSWRAWLRRLWTSRAAIE